MPDNLADKNVLVEITANGKTRSVPVLANAMTVTVNENYGQLQVTDAVNGKPLSQGLCEDVCPAGGWDGEVPQGRLHRSSRQVRLRLGQHARSSPIAKFGILVLSETQGALIRETSPPQQ